MDDVIPGNPPKQSRSRRTLDRIVKASLDILEEGGADALTVQEVVGRAHSSVGSFYARFASKEELLAYLGECVWREAASSWDTALATAGRADSSLASSSLDDAAELAVALLGDTLESASRRLRALRSAWGPKDRAYDSFLSHVVSGVEGILLAHRAEIAHPDPELAVRLGVVAALALLEEHRDGDLTASAPPALRRGEATRLLLRYLTAERQSGESSKGVDFFDVWG